MNAIETDCSRTYTITMARLCSDVLTDLCARAPPTIRIVNIDRHEKETQRSCAIYLVCTLPINVRRRRQLRKLGTTKRTEGTVSKQHRNNINHLTNSNKLAKATRKSQINNNKTLLETNHDRQFICTVRIPPLYQFFVWLAVLVPRIAQRKRSQSCIARSTHRKNTFAAHTHTHSHSSHTHTRASMECVRLFYEYI